VEQATGQKKKGKKKKKVPQLGISGYDQKASGTTTNTMGRIH